MKKLLFTALVLVSFIASSFAKESSIVSNRVMSNFNYDFKAAENVQWAVGDVYATASFTLNQKGTKAFYKHDGTLVGSAYSVSMEELPANAKRTFAKKYSNYTVTEAIRFDKADAYSYFISAENEIEKLVLQVENGQVSVYKKI